MSNNNKSVFYHPEEGRELEFLILSENADKTVNIGPDKDTVVVTSCKITNEVEIGSATLKSFK